MNNNFSRFLFPDIFKRNQRKPFGKRLALFSLILACAPCVSMADPNGYSQISLAPAKTPTTHPSADSPVDQSAAKISQSIIDTAQSVISVQQPQTLTPSPNTQAPQSMTFQRTDGKQPFAYDSADLCGLQTLLVMETLEQNRNQPKLTFDQFNTKIIRRFFAAHLLDNLSDNQKVYFINLIHQNAQTAYASAFNKQSAKVTAQRDNILQHQMWHQCTTDLSHS